MCRLAWQLLGMLGNILGLLGMLRNVLGMLCNVLGMLGNVLGLLGMPFRKVLGVLDFTAYKAASGRVFLRCETPRTLREACRGGQGRCKHA